MLLNSNKIVMSNPSFMLQFYDCSVWNEVLPTKLFHILLAFESMYNYV